VGPFFSWAVPGYALLLVVLGGLSGVFGWFTHFLHKEKSLPLGLAVPLAWVGVEWIKAHFPFGLAFPWLGLGITLSEWPDLIGLAEWTGEAGVAFWLAGVNGLGAAILLRRRFGSEREAPSSRRLWLLLGSIIGLPAALGLARAQTISLLDGPRVVVVGTRIPPELRGTAAAVSEAIAQVQDVLESMDSRAPDLVVLPEATVPFVLDEEEASAAREALTALASEWDAPFVVGALGRVSSGSMEGALTNSAYLLAPREAPSQRYDKVRLVPGMEAGSYGRGSDRETLQVGGWTLGPLLCYESLFGGLARKKGREGAQLLLNLSSDIWFGHEKTLMGSFFLHQHPAHLVFRAVENRISVARAANGGFSFLLDPRGRVVSETVPPTGGRAEARVPTFPGTTLFSRTGDWVGPGSALICLFLLLAGRSSWVRRGFSGAQQDS